MIGFAFPQDPELFEDLQNLKSYLGEELNSLDVTVISDASEIEYVASCNLR